MRPLKTAILLAAIAGPVMSGETAWAASGVNVGALSCVVEGGIGMILGSSKEMTCTFKPANGSPPEDYVGSVKKLGLDIGVTNEAHIGWLVFAPGDIEPGALEGSYAGASGEVTAGLGLGANVLIGGFERSIALQPVSVQGQTGLNVAVGISRMDLRHAE